MWGSRLLRQHIEEHRCVGLGSALYYCIAVLLVTISMLPHQRAREAKGGLLTQQVWCCGSHGVVRMRPLIVVTCFQAMAARAIAASAGYVRLAVALGVLGPVDRSKAAGQGGSGAVALQPRWCR